MNKNKIVAICYDFDGTLAPGNMQENYFIPKVLRMEKENFWEEVKRNAEDHDMDEILSYMEITLKKSREREIRFDKETFEEYGKKITFFEGVENWFGRINRYGEEKDLRIEHYIISSGLKPMIKGTSIAGEFKHIFACDFKYDAHKVPIFPSVAINYTTKTQYLFRINKSNSDNDLLNNWNEGVNTFIKDEDRLIPFSQMIYLGDGLTDVPAMKMIKFQGGYSVGVYELYGKRGKNEEETPKKVCEGLLKDKRCSFIAPANYEEGGELDKLIKKILDKIHAEIELKDDR